MNESKAFELMNRIDARVHNGKLIAPIGTSPEDMAQLRDNKDELMDFASGYCFDFQLRVGKQYMWSVTKASAIAYVFYPPITVFAGTAHEVDTWCAKNKNDPLFTDKCASRYNVGWTEELK